ncbi:MAG: TlpA family protein disulfide reductase [Gammaproteobacteria bacterium]|nr:TlpA family protein disulfide reductase [Gammaproteobacteria bacterium]
MRRVLFGLGMLALTLNMSSCQSQRTILETTTQFRLTNEIIQIISGDFREKSFTLTVSYEVTDENNEVSTVFLANGQLVDGTLKLDQTVTQPTEVEISVRGDSPDHFAKMTTVLRPASVIDFIVVHLSSTSVNYYMVFPKKNDHRSLNENLKFSMRGDLSHLHNLTPTRIEVWLLARYSFVDGSGEVIRYGPVVADEGEFSFEGDLDAPTLFTVMIEYSSDFFGGGLEHIHAILEPGVNYRVVPLGSQGRHTVIADRDSLHTQIISSWRLNPEFIASVDAWVDRRLDAIWGMDREAEEEHEKETVTKYQVAEQCDHMSLTDRIKSRFIEPFKHPYQKTADLIVTTRAEALRKILRDTQDPALVRMIYDLSWRLIEDDEISSERDIDEKIATLLELEQKMDQDYVDQFITPRIEYLRKEKNMTLRNKELLPGLVAPQFTLPSNNGDEVSLSEVLNENELVLVDFWTSRCDICIARFPSLKAIYSKYKDRGFEIVTISIDDSFEKWDIASDEQELPWIDVGDTEDGLMKIGSSPTADDYGVPWQFNRRFENSLSSIYRRGIRMTPIEFLSVGERLLPYGFLIDKEGCIVHKRFSDVELEILLSSQLVGTS